MNRKYLLQTAVFEGFSSTVYTCPAGKLTIGYGHNLQDDMKREEIDILFSGLELSKEKAEELLELDLQVAIREAPRLLSTIVGWTKLSKNRQYVLIDMCFNMGYYKLRGFTNTLAAIEHRDWELAMAEMMDSRWYRQVGVRGIFLADLMLTDIWEGVEESD